MEVAVRKVGDFEESDLGTKLMRNAFDVNFGPLTDSSRLPAERQAISDLFAGAVGLYLDGSHLDGGDRYELVLAYTAQLGVFF